MPSEEIALQTWLVMQQGGLVIPIQDVNFEQELTVKLAYKWCGRSHLVKGTVVSTTAHGTALQLTQMPDEVTAFFSAVEQGEDPPEEVPAQSGPAGVPARAPASEPETPALVSRDRKADTATHSGRRSRKLKGDFWSTMDEFSEIMLGGDPDEEDSYDEFDESQSVICEIHDTSSLELPEELLASLETSTPAVPVTGETGEIDASGETEEGGRGDGSGETEEARQSLAALDSMEQIREVEDYSVASVLEDSEESIGARTSEDEAFETLAQTLLGLDPDDLGDDEFGDDFTAEIDAMLAEAQKEDTLTDLAEPSVDVDVRWTAVPWTRRADRQGTVSREAMADLIKELAGGRATGILRLDLPDRTLYSLWLSGSPRYVTADPPEEGGELEHALAAFPLVEPAVFEQALVKSAEQDRHLALILIDVGILQTEDVRDMMGIMSRKAVRLLPMLTRGRYQFWECGVPMADEGLELELESVLAWEPGVSPPSEDSLL